jgi:mono/diheme cytochrome c family protein
MNTSRSIRRSLAQALLVVSCALSPLIAHSQVAALPSAAKEQIARGRYLVSIAQCNNCHTDGYQASGATLPESRWLDGTSRQWVTRDGTVWATNLRLLVQDIPVETWIELARNSRARAPMPWWSLRDMTDEDLRAVYSFIYSLGPSGKRAPAFVPADPSKPRPSGPVHE